jgi:hypothetical protein
MFRQALSCQVSPISAKPLLEADKFVIHHGKCFKIYMECISFIDVTLAVRRKTFLRLPMLRRLARFLSGFRCPQNGQPRNRRSFYS